jgi:hypothetical protein
VIVRDLVEPEEHARGAVVIVRDLVAAGCNAASTFPERKVRIAAAEAAASIRQTERLDTDLVAPRHTLTVAAAARS